jgi:hypothetical protein
MVERDGFTFNLVMVYESLPEFYSHRKTLGHHISNCKWLHPATENDPGKQALDKEMGHNVIKREYVLKLQIKNQARQNNVN